MSDKDDKNSDGSLSESAKSEGKKKTLSLKTANIGGQASAPAPSRTVVVKTRRRIGATTSPQSPPQSTLQPKPTVSSEKKPLSLKPNQPASSQQASQSRSNTKAKISVSSSAPIRGLTAGETNARERVLREAAKRAEEDSRLFQEQEKKRVENDIRRRQERELEAEKQRELEKEKTQKAQKPTDVTSDAPNNSDNEKKAKASPKEAKKETFTAPVLTQADAEAVAERQARGGKSGAARNAPLVNKDELERARKASRATPTPSRRNDVGGNSRGRLTVTSALNDGGDRDRAPSLAAMRRRREKQRGKQVKKPQPKLYQKVTLPEAISVQELANRMKERSVDVIKLLMEQGQMATINDILDADTAELIATELGHSVKRVAESDVEGNLFENIEQDNEEDLEPRPAVVTIMGHVDHGKTSLLDAIREANVVSGEAGGITQHIGAYQVEKDGQKITFLDTPGHEAFTAMRSRGAQATDIAILVVAADDSVMPQTIESIKHAKAAEVPIIVAINKIDKPGADANKVRTELLQHEVFVESMGGEVLDVEVSALKKMNLDKLLEAIQLQAELLDLKANPNGIAQGIVIEAKLDKGRGAVATVLVQRGSLKVSDVVVAGSKWARVRALINDKGEQVKNALPSLPVEILGFAGVPNAGDRFSVVENEAKAREITEYRTRSVREKSAVGGVTSLETMMDQLKTSDITRFPLIIKGDVQGSVEAIIASLNKLGNDEVSAQILLSGVGGITESDVTLAQASNAIIIAFNVRANKQAREAATRDGIEIRYYNIIYNLIDDVKSAMSGLLSPERRETFIGYAEILEVFNITKVGKVAGCRVTEGIVERGSGVRLLRDNVVIHEGELSTLKRFKDEVKDVKNGQECGMAFLNYQDMRKGDVIECFRVEQIERSL